MKIVNEFVVFWLFGNAWKIKIECLWMALEINGVRGNFSLYLSTYIV